MLKIVIANLKSVLVDNLFEKFYFVRSYIKVGDLFFCSHAIYFTFV